MEKRETEDDLERQLDEVELQGRMRRIGRKFLIMSGKGGVGKSTFAVNLATALVRDGARVGLLDVDLHGPSIPGLLGLEGERLRPGAGGEIRPLLTPEGLEVVSLGLILPGTGEAVVWRGPLKYKAIHQFLQDVDWGSLDYLVVDSPPGTGDEPLSIAQLAGPGTEAVLVTTPQERALDDVRRSVSFCRLLNLPAAGIVENMSGLVCPHCGVEIDLFKHGGGEKLAAETGVPFLGRIPLDGRIVDSGETGRPFVSADPDGPPARALRAVIAALIGNPAAAPGTGGASTTTEERP